MPADCLDPRPLGSSGIEVSALSLGSWRTYERLPAPLSAAIMRAAREEGITFFDDARYNDETGPARIPTGCSEVVFGNVFRAAGLRRDEVVLANKLWWEFWPGQSAAADHIGQGQNVGHAGRAPSRPGARGGAVSGVPGRAAGDELRGAGASLPAGWPGGRECAVRRNEPRAAARQLRRGEPAGADRARRPGRAETDRVRSGRRRRAARRTYQRSPLVST